MRPLPLCTPHPVAPLTPPTEMWTGSCTSPITVWHWAQSFFWRRRSCSGCCGISGATAIGSAVHFCLDRFCIGVVAPFLRPPGRAHPLAYNSSPGSRPGLPSFARYAGNAPILTMARDHSHTLTPASSRGARKRHGLGFAAKHHFEFAAGASAGAFRAAAAGLSAGVSASSPASSISTAEPGTRS